MIIKIYNLIIILIVIHTGLDWSGKNGHKSGNFDILCEW